jgi:putative ABC transport system permease protein
MIMQDVKYAFRLARRSPAFTGIAVLTLAVGIGANTAVFNLAHALLLRSLPVPEPQNLIRYRLTADGAIPGLDLPPTFLPDFGLSGPMFDALRGAQSSAVSIFAWMRADGLTVVREGQRYPVRAAWASAATFPVLNIKAAAGRLLEERDDRQGADGSTGVISYQYWTDTWNRDPAVVGRTIIVEELPVTIVGVLPESFSGVLIGDAPQLILPLEFEAIVRGDDSLRNNPGALVFTVMGRLTAGATLASAAAELDALAPRLIDEAVPVKVRDDTFRALRLDVESARSGWSSYRMEYERPLRQIQWFTGIVLLVISANLAGLLLGRGASRQREFGVRASLGASWGVLLRQLLVEHAVLAAMAVPIGCGVAVWLSQIAVAFFGQAASVGTDGSLVVDLRPSAALVAVGAMAGLASIVIAGAIPSLLATSRAATPGVRNDLRSTVSVGRFLMPIQVALSLVLVALAMSAGMSIFRLLSTPAGMSADGVMMAVPDLRARTERGAERLALYDRITTELASKPGIQSVAIARGLPMSGGWNDAHYVGESANSVREDEYTVQNIVGPGFFTTLGIRMLAGRDFSAADRSGSADVCVLNQSAAAHFFPGLAPIGRYIDRRQSNSQRAVRCEVVGLVEDAKYWTLNQDPPRTVYRPFAQEPPRAVAFVAKGPSNPMMATAFREVFGSVLPDGMVVTPVTLADQTLGTVSVQRALGWIAGALGLLALMLTCLSLYGQVAWSVTIRTAEFGIRLAIGSTPHGIVQLVMRDLRAPLLLGTCGGLVAVALLSNFVATLLYKTKVVDPALLAAAVIALGVACASAAYLPARRAANVEPSVALRIE